MKKKLTVFALSAILAVSGLTAINSAFNSSDVLAQDKTLGNYFEYSEDVVTLEENKIAPSYLVDGTKSTEGVKTFNDGKTGKNPVGVGFTATDNAVIKLKNPIYVGDNDMSEPLIEFMINPDKCIPEAKKDQVSTGEIEFERVVITLTDVNNENNWVEITSVYSQTNSNQSWIEISSPTHTRAGVNKGILTSEDNKKFGWGTGIRSGYCGGSKETSAIFFDNSEYAFYAAAPVQPASVVGKDITIVRDLDNPNHYLYGDGAFLGFSSGFVNVSIAMKNLQTNACHMILKSIDGQDFTSNEGVLIDNCAPSLSLDKNALVKIPEGEVGRVYPFMNTEAFDIIDGEDVTTIIKVYDENNTEVASTNKGFIPSKVGYYKTVYTVADKAGNTSAPQEITVKISEVTPDFELVFDDPTQIVHEVPVGKEFVIPTAKIIGGSGYSTLNVYVEDSATGEVVSRRKMFTPELPGWYKIVYEYTDYLEETKYFVIDVDATLASVPVINDVSVPEVVLKGKMFEVPTAYAVDYSSFNGEGRAVDSYAEYKFEWTEGDQLKFTEWEKAGEFITPTNEGKLYLRYKASSVLDKDAVATSKEYVIDVRAISTKNKLYEFFNRTGNVELEHRKMTAITTHTIFKGLEDGARLQFVNKLPESGFAITLNYDDKDTIINQMTLILQDSVVASERVSFVITPMDVANSIVRFNEINYKVDGGFYATESTSGDSIEINQGFISLKLREDALFSGSVKISDILTYDNGVEYSGFSSGKVYTTITFDDVDESKIANGIKTGVRITDFCGQTRFGPSDKDNGAPIVSIDRELSTYYNMNTYLTIPSAFAVDMFDPKVNCYLTVTNPKGEEVLSKVSTDVEHVIQLTEIGQYTIQYYSEDSDRNDGGKTFSLYSADTFDPVIEIGGQFKTTAKVGEEYTIHSARATDNYDAPEDLRIYVYVFDPTGYISCPENRYTETKEITYKFTQTGTYRIRYFVMDSYGNYCHKVFMVEVTA